MKKKIYHKDLKERFKNLSIFEQMANIGAEVGRVIKKLSLGIVILVP